MESKPPFEAEHNSICAYADMPILKFYEGYFDAVYIMLHPFYKTDDKGAIIELISWEKMISIMGFKDINQLDIALRNLIVGLVKKWENHTDVEILKSTCDLHDIKMPYEGQFQETLEREMLLGLQEQGHQYMFVADEFGFERKCVYITDFMEGREKVTLEMNDRSCWYSNKNEILYAVHWDSYFTLLCSDKKTIENILSKHPFEGFYCDDQTEIYWSCRAIENQRK